MAEKIIQTRIINKNDTELNWLSHNIVLKEGELALVKRTVNAIPGESAGVQRYFIKVGDGIHNFDALPWADCSEYIADWAKTGNQAYIDVPALESLVDEQGVKLGSAEGAITDLQATLQALTGSGEGTSIDDRIQAALDTLDFTNAQATGSGSFVTVITQTNGKIAVQKKTIAESDLPQISASKINVSSDKTLDTKLSEIASAISTLQGNHSQDVESIRSEIAKYTSATFLLGSGKFADKGQALKNSTRKNGAVWLVTQDDNTVAHDAEGYNPELNRTGKEYLFHTSQTDEQLAEWTVAQFNDIANWTELGDVSAQDSSITSLTGRVSNLENTVNKLDGDVNTAGSVKNLINDAKGTLMGEITDVDTKVGTVSDNLAAYMQSNNTALQAEADARTDADTALEDQIIQLGTNVETAISTTKLAIETDYNTKINTAKGRIDTLAGDIHFVESSTTKPMGPANANINVIDVKTADRNSNITLVLDCGTASAVIS